MSLKCIILAAMALLPFSMMIAAASEEQALLEAALSRGDECVGDGSDEQCTLAALQLRAQKARTEEKKESGQEHDKKEGEISTKAASLDGTLVEKLGMYTAQPLCKGAGEGTICVPQNSYLYCSVGQQLNFWNGHAGTVTCESQMGKMSWCLKGGSGMDRVHCDDPFCRNGGATSGNGEYCHKGAVVLCQGQNAPSTTDPCSDNTFIDPSDSDCEITEIRSCTGGFPDPYCQVTGSRRACTTTTTGSYGYSSYSPSPSNSPSPSYSSPSPSYSSYGR